MVLRLWVLTFLSQPVRAVDVCHFLRDVRCPWGEMPGYQVTLDLDPRMTHIRKMRATAFKLLQMEYKLN